MNFKIKAFVVLLIISVFLLSSCEVYQTLYGTKPKEPAKEMEEAGKVFRVEGADGNDPKNLAKTAYASSMPVPHDPFKVGLNPLGPFEEGKSLGFTLGQWLAATGSGIYSVDRGNAVLNLSFENLVPKGVYTVWCSRLTFPPNSNIVDLPCGAADGSENVFNTDEEGSANFNLKLKPLEQSTKETASAIAIAYHSDGKTYGANPGDFGLNSHVQLFFLMPIMNRTPSTYKVDIEFVNHIDAGLPEQDVFIEKEEAMEKPEEVVEEKPEITGEVTKPEEEIEEKPEEVVEVPEGEMPKEKPLVVVVQETDLVSLEPKAEDPDRDTSLVFTYTSPLDDNGEWQTAYGDAGEYTITVTASDGELTTTRDILIIVNKKEEVPVIESSKPIETGLTIDETEAIDFSVVATDLNKDPLSYAWKVDGGEVGTESDYTYTTTYDDAGTHTVKVDVADDISTTSKIWSVNVNNVNRKPVLEKIEDIKAKETDKITITTLATDDDKDSITYGISDDKFTQDNNVFTWQTDYDSAGTYEVTVTASDGQDTTEQSFTVTVENVNRPPIIVDITQKK